MSNKMARSPLLPLFPYRCDADAFHIPVRFELSNWIEKLQIDLIPSALSCRVSVLFAPGPLSDPISPIPRSRANG
jgi:hypothetical protein